MKGGKPALRRRDSPDLLLIRSVGWIVGRFNFRKPLHARSVDLSDGVPERLTLDLLHDRAVLDLPLQADELPLLEGLGEVREIAPGVDAVPFGGGFVFALVVLAALAGGDAEDNVVLLVLRGFDFGILSETRDEDSGWAAIGSIGGRHNFVLLAMSYFNYDMSVSIKLNCS